MNIYENIPHQFDDEITDTIIKGKNIRIERIVSDGQTTPENFWYDQNENEWLTLIDGKATLLFENGKEITLKKGDTLLIKSHEKHKVTYTSHNPVCLWLCVFYK